MDKYSPQEIIAKCWSLFCFSLSEDGFCPIHAHWLVSVLLRTKTEQRGRCGHVLDLHLNTVNTCCSTYHSKKGASIIWQGGYRSNANSCDGRSSRSSNGEVGWRKQIQKQLMFSLGLKSQRSPFCSVELHILWEIFFSHLECEILGVINWSFT